MPIRTNDSRHILLSYQKRRKSRNATSQQQDEDSIIVNIGFKKAEFVNIFVSKEAGEER